MIAIVKMNNACRLQCLAMKMHSFSLGIWCFFSRFSLYVGPTAPEADTAPNDLWPFRIPCFKTNRTDRRAKRNALNTDDNHDWCQMDPNVYGISSRLWINLAPETWSSHAFTPSWSYAAWKRRCDFIGSFLWTNAIFGMPRPEAGTQRYSKLWVYYTVRI